MTMMNSMNDTNKAINDLPTKFSKKKDEEMIVDVRLLGSSSDISSSSSSSNSPPKSSTLCRPSLSSTSTITTNSAVSMCFRSYFKSSKSSKSSKSISSFHHNFNSAYLNFIAIVLLISCFSISSVVSLRTDITVESSAFNDNVMPTQIDADECENWLRLCRRIGDNVPYKKCINDTIYIYKTFHNRWSWDRFYCQAAFNGNRNSDLLYLHEQRDIDNFKEFVSKLPDSEKRSEVSTSALCCLREKNKNECFWPQSNQKLMALNNENLDDLINKQNDELECTFITIQLSPKPEEIKFQHLLAVSSEEQLPFICTYKLHSSCRDYIPTQPTTTTTSTISTRPPYTIITTTPTANPTNHPTNDPTTPPPTETPIPDYYCKAPNGAHGIDYWPPVLPGQVSEAKCPKGSNGKAEWKCTTIENRAQFVELPNITCVQVWIDDLSKKIHKTKNIDQLIEHAESFNKSLHDSRLNFHSELNRMFDIVHTIQYYSDKLYKQFKSDTVTKVTSLVVEGCSKIVGNRKAWMNDASPQSRTVMAESVLRYIQYSGFTYGCVEASDSSESDNRIKVEDKSKIFLDTFNMDRDQLINFKFDGINFGLTSNLTSNGMVSNNCQHKIGVGAVFKDLSSHLLSTNGVMIDNSTDFDINSEIVAFNYNNRTISETYELPNGTLAKMTLRHQNRLEFGAKPRCVYWKFSSVNSSGNDGSWSSDGCWLDESNSGRDESTCVCTHLTNFAVLMDVSGRERPSTVKSVLTILVTSLSVICLILTIVLFTICRELQNRRSTIIINLSACLVVVDLLVLFGLDQTQYSILCKAISAILLYSLLASFSWMLMEGYHLYQMIILVFSNIGHLKMLYLYLIGYGGPLLVTIIAVIPIAINDGLSDYFCWISSSKRPYQIWALTGPATLIIVINTVIMYYVMRTAFNMKFNKNGKFNSAPFGSTSATTTTTSVNSSNDSKKNHDKTEPSSGRPLPSSTVYYRTNQNIVSKSGGDTPNPGMGNFQGIGVTAAAGGNQTIPNYNRNNSKNSENNSNLDSEKFSQWISYLKGYVSLMILMGITWITYVLYIHEFGHFFSYVFIVLNGLQGVFIFITQFLFNKKAVSAVKRRFNQLFGDEHGLFSNLSSTSQTKSNTHNTNSSTFASSNSHGKDLETPSMKLYQNLTTSTTTTTMLSSRKTAATTTTTTTTGAVNRSGATWV